MEFQREAIHRTIFPFVQCRILVPLFVLLLLFGLRLAAQVTTSTIQGSVSDSQGLRIPGADVTISGAAMASALHVRSGPNGGYRLPALPAGEYSITVSHQGFQTKTFQHLAVSLNQTLTFNVVLDVGSVSQEVKVTAQAPLLQTTASSTGGTISPQQIEQMPLNGRNYLDLMQLVPGVTINRQNDPTSDDSTPILGERGGNAVFLIDGLPNSNEASGGSAAPFNQDSIMEFQVLTSAYKAEFGHGSGGVVNVVSKSGTDTFHGGVSFFHRNYVLDSSDQPNKGTPFLLRYDPTVYLGGPIVKDKIFFFGSAERIRETRDLGFVFPSNIPPVLQQFEAPFDLHSQTYETLLRGKLDEQIGRQRLSEQVNVSNNHVTDFLPLTAALNLPDTRSNISGSSTMVGLTDLVMLGDRSNPYLLNAYFQYLRLPFLEQPAHPQAGTASTLFNLFSSLDTGLLFGDQGQVSFGPGYTPTLIKQEYYSSGVSLGHEVGRHNWKFGWDFQRMRVDGVESNNLFNQLFSTISDFQQFGPIDSGVYFLIEQGGATPADNQMNIKNSYNGLYAEDDWQLAKNFTANLGVRWDYDNSFPNNTNFSPRIGFAWAVTPKTVINASWGLFYDHFRLGLARDIPPFGGADITGTVFLSYPRLFYGDPSLVSVAVGGPCLASDMTDAQIAASGSTCPLNPAAPYYGVDHLNSVVAAGHAPIPANSVVNTGNVQSLTGFSPQQFADAASAAMGQAPGYFAYDSFGNLTITSIFGSAIKSPITVDSRFLTPYTNNFHVGVEREISTSMAISADYFHKEIDNILGVRATNLAFEARLNGHTGETTNGQPITETYGPWYHGVYDGLTLDFKKRLTRRFNLELSYTYANETDNALNSNFVTNVQGAGGSGVEFTALGGPTDSFVGVPPVVTDPVTGQTNANGSFVVSGGPEQGNPVPQAGKFYNGANLDKGPSDLALTHMFFTNGTWQLPLGFSISGIFRAQSGFRYSESQATGFTDVDGDNIFNGLDWQAGRNHFTAPAFVNLDMRVAKDFVIHDRVRTQILLEYFNLLNRNNPAAVQTLTGLPVPFGADLQVLPGREGQVGIRFEF